MEVTLKPHGEPQLGRCLNIHEEESRRIHRDDIITQSDRHLTLRCKGHWFQITTMLAVTFAKIKGYGLIKQNSFP
jgi:hypothetical protein